MALYDQNYLPAFFPSPEDDLPEFHQLRNTTIRHRFAPFSVSFAANKQNFALSVFRMQQPNGSHRFPLVPLIPLSVDSSKVMISKFMHNKFHK